MITNFSERLQLARASGGRAATAYWLANRLLCIETYKFCATKLPASSLKVDMTLPAGCAYICVDSESMERCDPSVLATLDNNNGVAVADTVASGGRVYAIVRGNQVLTQQRVEFGKSYTASPYPMELLIGDHEAFFSYLYTLPAERGRGWARRLTHYEMEHLANEGVTRCISHTRATNIGSLATRFRCGWKLAALLYCYKPAKRGFIRRLPAWREIGCTLQAIRARF